MLARNDLADYLLDYHGHCDRSNGRQNNCYWDTDAAGRENGCLKVGWLGRACKYWHPIKEERFDAILKASEQTS